MSFPPTIEARARRGLPNLQHLAAVLILSQFPPAASISVRPRLITSSSPGSLSLSSSQAASIVTGAEYMNHDDEAHSACLPSPSPSSSSDACTMLLVGYMYM
ncbi:hypothetical protein VDGL01_01854 [Verticillium dahliae]